jgi:hypothetical protein
VAVIISGVGDELLVTGCRYFKCGLDFCLTVHHQLDKVIQMNQLDATMIL